MNILKFLFKKKQITYLGRGGIKYFDGVNDFYIDTNNIQGHSLTIELFRKDITRADKEPLTDDEKTKIAVTVKNILEKKKIHVVVTPSIL